MHVTHTHTHSSLYCIVVKNDEKVVTLLDLSMHKNETQSRYCSKRARPETFNDILRRRCSDATTTLNWSELFVHSVRCPFISMEMQECEIVKWGMGSVGLEGICFSYNVQQSPKLGSGSMKSILEI